VNDIHFAVETEVAEEILTEPEVLKVNKRLLAGANPDVESMPMHRDQVDKLVDSFRLHGYRPEMADHAIEVLLYGRSLAVLEGSHRVWAAYHAGVKELPVEVARVDKKRWRKATGT
jgi:hypothetical protein